MATIFFSHAHEDKPFVRQLAKDLTRAGHDVWMDEVKIRVGDSLIERIQDALEHVDYVVAVISESSVRSNWVKKELQVAMAREIARRQIHVLPVLLHDVHLPCFLSDKMYADFRQGKKYDLAVSKLLKSIEYTPCVTTRLSMPQNSLNHDWTFDSFVVGPENNRAHSVCMAAAYAKGPGQNPLLIFGGVGSGKSHLVSAITHRVQAYNDRTVRYASMYLVVMDFLWDANKEYFSRFIEDCERVDVIILEEIRHLAMSDAIQEILAPLWESCLTARRQIVVTSDEPPSNVVGLTERVVSLFEKGLVVKITPPGLQTRMDILKMRFARAGVQLSDELIATIANRVTKDARLLNGAVATVSAYISLLGREIEMDSLTTLIGHLFDSHDGSEETEQLH